jgi:hypothetical protein
MLAPCEVSSVWKMSQDFFQILKKNNAKKRPFSKGWKTAYAT